MRPAVAIAAERAGTPWSTLLLLGGLAVVWGLNWPAMKFVLAEMPVLTFRTLCLEITGPILILLARLGGETIGIPRREWPALAFTAFFNVTIWYFGTAMGLTLIPAGRAALLAYTMPVWVALLSAVALRERLPTRRLLGLAVGMAGIGLLLAPEVATLRAAPVGAGFVLLAAFGWAVGTVGMKYFSFSRSVAQVTGWQLLLGGIPIMAGAVATDPPLRLAALDGATQAVLAYIITLPMIFGQYAWFKSLSRLSGTVAAISSLAVPAVGLISSTLLLGERLGPLEAAALAFMVTALSLVLIRPEPRAARTPPLGGAAPTGQRR